MSNDPKQAKTILGWLPQHDPKASNAAGGAPQPHVSPVHQGYPPAQQVPPQAGAPWQPPQVSQPQSGNPPPQPGAPWQPPQVGQPQSGNPPPQPGAPWQPPQSRPESGYPQAPAQGYNAVQPSYSPSPYPQPHAGYSPSQVAQVGPAPASYPQGYGGQGHGAYGQPAQAQHGSGMGGFAGVGGAGLGGAAGLEGAAGVASKLGWSSEPKANSAQASSDLRANASATVGVSDRVRFIRLTYLHLLGAILVFAGLEYLLMTNETLIELVSIPLVKFAIGGRWNWGIVLAAFMAVSWVADYWASHSKSRGLQYAGLGFYVVAEALIFVPLLAIVQWKTAQIIARGGGDPNIIRDAAFTTLAIFGALTASVLVTKKDFSFMRTGLAIASAAAMMLVILSLVFGFNLGIVFSIAMVLLAAGYILYQTSQILAHYDPQNYVAASLALFSSVALMFWYVIRIFMRARE